ncbi:MAG: hypothetical protein QE263_05800 [Vampirovibrionales bacterium]|nr:hypothetical protein [Vampirovibrionales bacterium]
MSQLLKQRIVAVSCAVCVGMVGLFAPAFADSAVLLASSFSPSLAAPSLVAPTLPELLNEAAQQSPSIFKINIQHSDTLSDDSSAKKSGRHGRSRRSKETVASHIQLDDEARTIGGQLSDGDAAKLRPAQKYLFELPKVVNNKTVWLSIGKLNGIHTPQAHTLGQTSDDHISSPLAIKLNGKTIQYVYVNGDNLHIRIPKSLLNKEGYNALQLQAGYYYSAPNTIAYDRVSFENVRLEPS